MNRTKAVTGVCIILVLVATTLLGQGLLKISDEDAISLRLDQLRSSITRWVAILEYRKLFDPYERV